jgi:hypothetical protein
MSDFNVDYDKLKTARIENGDIIPLGSDVEYHAEFTNEKVPNFEGTDYVEIPHLRLQAPGNTKAIYHQPVRFESHPDRPSDPERFPRQWAAFQAGQNIEQGLSIFNWEGVTAADARRFELQGIKTVQQLAHVSDMNLSGLGVGAMALRDKAREFLSGNTIEVELRQQLGEQNDQISKLTDIVNNLLAQQPPAKAAKKEKVDG